MNEFELEKLIKWPMDGAQTAPSPDTLLSEICERLVTIGVKLWRVGVLVQTLRPDALGRNFVWQPGADVAIETAGFDLPESHRFLQSPLSILYSSGHEVRYRLDDPESNRFPFFDEMRAQGARCRCASPTVRFRGMVYLLGCCLRIGRASARIPLEPSCRHGASGWHRSKLCELPQVLGDGREQELVSRAARPRNLRRPSLRMRLRWANSISTFFRRRTRSRIGRKCRRSGWTCRTPGCAVRSDAP
jgi:hypothetical protein